MEFQGRWRLAGRLVLAIIGAYGVMWLVSGALARWLPLSSVSVVSLVSFVGPLLTVGLVLWILSTKRLAFTALILMGIAVVSGLGVLYGGGA